MLLKDLLYISVCLNVISVPCQNCEFYIEPTCMSSDREVSWCVAENQIVFTVNKKVFGGFFQIL